MFDIGWSEFAVIAVVALIAIGPKELPGVLRMVGQWIGKARRMAAEFQGQFQEAMREAEMADLKKSFDEVKEAASGFTKSDVMTSLHRDVTSALGTDDKPAASAETVSAEAASSSPEQITSSPEQVPSPEPEQSASPVAEATTSAPLVITPEGQPQPVTTEAHSTAAEAEAPREAKAS